MEKSDVTEQTAYTVLSYAIYKAFSEKKAVKIKLQIPYNNLAKSMGAEKNTQYEEAALTINTTISWEPLEKDLEIL